MSSTDEPLSRYEMLEVLGRGAMGVVYKARDRELERIVAIKTIRPEGRIEDATYAAERKRLQREAMAAARLNHPGIVGIYDVILVEDVPHVVMEYVEGETLAAMLANGPLPVERAVGLIWQVCRALEYAHTQGVVHRDIKSSNIIVDRSGRAKLGDFGVARIADKQATQTTAAIGTPAYMAPEQLRGRGADERSDLFSLAVVLYEALTARNPFRGEDVATVLYEIAHGSAVPAREHNAAVPPGLDAVIKRALSKEPDDRYPSARAFAEALRQSLAAPQGGWSWRPALWSVGARRAVAAGTIAVAAVSVGVVTTIAGSRPETFRGSGPRMPVALQRGLPAAATLSGVPPYQAASATADAGRPAASVKGTIVVETDPSVEVFVDGVFRGRTKDRPVVVRDLAAGSHDVTLRLGARQRTLTGRLKEGQTLTFAYSFAPKPEAGSQAASPPPASAPSIPATPAAPRSPSAPAQPVAPAVAAPAAIARPPAPAISPPAPPVAARPVEQKPVPPPAALPNPRPMNAPPQVVQSRPAGAMPAPASSPGPTSRAPSPPAAAQASKPGPAPQMSQAPRIVAAALPKPEAPAAREPAKPMAEPPTSRDATTDREAAGESFGCLSVNAVPFATVYVDGQRAGDTPRACVRVRAGSRQVHFVSADGRSPDRTVVVTAEHTKERPLRLSYDFNTQQFVGP
jgi:serine/threonine-protein kinase